MPNAEKRYRAEWNKIGVKRPRPVPAHSETWATIGDDETVAISPPLQQGVFGMYYLLPGATENIRAVAIETVDEFADRVSQITAADLDLLDSASEPLARALESYVAWTRDCDNDNPSACGRSGRVYLTQIADLLRDLQSGLRTKTVLSAVDTAAYWISNHYVQPIYLAMLGAAHSVPLPTARYVQSIAQWYVDLMALISRLVPKDVLHGVERARVTKVDLFHD